MNNNKKIILCILLVLFLGISCILSFFLSDDKIEAEERIEIIDAALDKDEVITNVKVDIKGAIKTPGVYEVPNYSRVIDIIEIAGGLKKGANTEYINLAKLVEDEMIIWIYTDSEIKKFEEGNIKYEYIEKECNCPDVTTSACIEQDNTTVNGKVNINTATIDELMTLTGIGEAKAISIIEYREQNPFTTIEDIKNVSGIGDKAFEKIKDNITV